MDDPCPGHCAFCDQDCYVDESEHLQKEVNELMLELKELKELCFVSDEVRKSKGSSGCPSQEGAAFWNWVAKLFWHKP